MSIHDSAVNTFCKRQIQGLNISQHMVKPGSGPSDQGDFPTAQLHGKFDSNLGVGSIFPPD